MAIISLRDSAITSCQTALRLRPPRIPRLLPWKTDNSLFCRFIKLGTDHYCYLLKLDLFDNQNHNVNRRVVKAFPFQAAPTDCVTCSLVPVTGELVISLPIVLSRQSLTSLLPAIIDYKLPRRSLCRNCILSNPSHF